MVEALATLTNIVARDNQPGRDEVGTVHETEAANVYR
ncbi:hypothetical protein A2U01_0101003, partial [Trifolium medium]|nr:hypothetical protein [Trifolium medium]